MRASMVDMKMTSSLTFISLVEYDNSESLIRTKMKCTLDPTQRLL